MRNAIVYDGADTLQGHENFTQLTVQKSAGRGRTFERVNVMSSPPKELLSQAAQQKM
ncbi:hypothetical protein AGMMS49974_08840 [Deltaproteobacteria bacterium]|nr:hypothetical protein AGMMS49925_02250 [Deltaproteobacteria bacterium]GHU96006.1 hypothetical protein AGMMS49974_08840 [Deltaproteobacteria bacterium]